MVIKEETDIAITHEPPHGILYRTEAKELAGSRSLFAAIATACPRLHCFGIHRGWGTKLVRWRDVLEETPSHFNAIDNDNSTLVKSPCGIKAGKFDPRDTAGEKMEKNVLYRRQGAFIASHCMQSFLILETVLSDRAHTLFVSVSIQCPSEEEEQLPWVLDLDLNKAYKA